MPCRSYLLAVALLALLPAAADAQPPVQPENGKHVVRLTVDATPAPVPALKYLLLTELRDQLPGNRVQAYYKCFFEQYNFYYGEESIKNRDRWQTAPLAELKGEKGLIGYGGSGLRQADYAARLDTVDWQFTSQIKNDGINALLPDIQQMRMLAGALKVKLRGQTARGEYDDAVRTAQTLLTLARAFNEHPTLIAQLVGAAITAITFDPLEEMIAQPGAPNLYWALSDLPAPFINLRLGMQGERGWTEKDYGKLRKADPIAETELQRMLDELSKIAKSEGGDVAFTTEWAGGLAADPAVFDRAKARLVKAGFKPAAVDKMSRLQVFLSDDFRDYEAYRDDLLKWTNVPFWQLPADLDTPKTPQGGFRVLVVAAKKVFMAQARTEQRIGLLRAVEAVRLYAAAHGGQFPAKLDEVGVPLPVDPFSGKPFAYELKDGKAVLRGTPPAEFKDVPVYNRVYELTIRK